MKRSVWVQLMAFLMLAIQGFAFLMPCHALTLPPKSTEIHASPLQNHTEYCHCLKCAGEKSCCCRPTKNPLAGIIMSAACEKNSDSATVQFVVFRALPSLSVFVNCAFDSETACFAWVSESVSSLSPQPLPPPPCLA